MLSLERESIKLQKIKIKRNYRLGKYRIKLQSYSLKNLHKESDLFFDWYLKYCSKNSRVKKIKKILKYELNKIYKKLYFKNNIFFILLKGPASIVYI